MSRSYVIWRENVYYDDGEAWTLKRDLVHGKKGKGQWIRAPEYDKRV